MIQIAIFSKKMPISFETRRIIKIPLDLKDLKSILYFWSSFFLGILWKTLISSKLRYENLILRAMVFGGFNISSNLKSFYHGL